MLNIKIPAKMWKNTMQVIRQNSPNKVRGASSHRIAYSDALVLPKDFREVLIKTPSPFLLPCRNLSSQSPQGLWLITHTRLHSYLIHRGSLEGQVHRAVSRVVTPDTSSTEECPLILSASPLFNQTQQPWMSKQGGVERAEASPGAQGRDTGRPSTCCGPNKVYFFYISQ